MSPLFEIAPFAESDLPHLFGLAKSVFADLSGWNDDAVLDALSSDVLFVAREDGLAAGYVALRLEQDGTCVVEQLFVVPGHEHHGIGQRLLHFVEGYAIAVRAPSLRIVVERSNEQGRSFFRRWGFVPVEDEVFELTLPKAS